MGRLLHYSRVRGENSHRVSRKALGSNVVVAKKTYSIAPTEIAIKRKTIVTQRTVNRVLQEIGAKMNASVNERFLRCLKVCDEWYSDAILYNHGGPQKHQREYLCQLTAAINALLPLLNVDRMPNNLQGFLPVLAPFANLPAQLEELNEKLQRVAELRSDSKPRTGLESDFVDLLKYQDHFKERSPFDWLAGVYLPELYYLFFRFESGWGKGRKFLLFGDVVLRAMKVTTVDGKFYSTKAISRAVRIKPDIKQRRKKGPLVDRDVPDQLEWYRHMHFMDAVGVRIKSSLEYARDVLADLNTPT
jgi:hypothetical protein